MQWTPPDSAGERPDGDDTGDLFLKIAREDPSQRSSDGSKIYHTDNSNIIVSTGLLLSVYSPTSALMFRFELEFSSLNTLR